MIEATLYYPIGYHCTRPDSTRATLWDYNKIPPRVRSGIHQIRMYGLYSLGAGPGFCNNFKLRPIRITLLTPVPIRLFPFASLFPTFDEPWHDELEELEIRFDEHPHRKRQLKKFTRSALGVVLHKRSGGSLKVAKRDSMVEGKWTGKNLASFEVTEWQSITIVWRDEKSD